MNYTLECEPEDDGRWLAEVLELPGVLAYGDSKEQAMVRAETTTKEAISKSPKNKTTCSNCRRREAHIVQRFPSGLKSASEVD